MKNKNNQLETAFNKHIERHVIDDLQQTRYNGKPLYSYSDIADRHNLSVSTVQRIAIAQGLTRRSNNLA
jgi:AraC-like DNA-binding protein